MRDPKAISELKLTGSAPNFVVKRDWPVVRLWEIARIRSEKNRPDLPLLSVFLNRGVIAYGEGGGQVHKPGMDLSIYQVVRRGDFVLNNQQGWRGSVGVSNHEGIISPAYVVLALDSVLNPRFANYLFQSPDLVAQYVTSSKGVGDIQRDIHMPWLKNVKVPIPPAGEQAAIVRFLDWANGCLERAIRAKRKAIALFNEQKQAIINQVVTKGLNSDVRLKPSGTIWLGDIPDHWAMRKLKFEMAFSGGGTPSKANPAYWDGDIPWVSPKDMKSDAIGDAEDHIAAIALEESSTRLVPAGSLLIVVRSGILQRTIPVALTTREMALNQDMKALTSKGRLGLAYLSLLIRGCERRLLAEWTKQGATVESIEHQFLANTKVPIPPPKEQEEIVSEATIRIEPISKAVRQTQKEIGLLHEYRIRLIADVVTGKLDVRKMAASLPDALLQATSMEAADLETEETSHESSEADSGEIIDA